MKSLATIVLVLAAAVTAAACSTPVYRYAMYNWAPAPYIIFDLFQGSRDKQDEATDRALGRTDGTSIVANVQVETIDAARKEMFEPLPEPIKKAWQTRAPGSRGLHVVMAPWGTPLFSGRLDAKSAATMFDSPLRSQLGKLLHAGDAVILLTLTCADRGRNQQAEKAVDEVLALVKAGKIATAPADDAPRPAPPVVSGDPGAPGDENRPPKAGQLKVGKLSLSRTDPAEDWLVRVLMRVEAGLDEYAGQPMVFAVYGRGRVMPPFVGKGITADNLGEAVSFLSGACSCQVKDENPGVELPMRWDWQATADALAANDQDSDGGQVGYREVTAGEANPPGPAARSGAPGPKAVAAAAGASRPSSPALLPTKAVPAVPVLPSAVALGAHGGAADSGQSVAFFAGQAFTYGAGVVTAALLVLIVGRIWVRGKGAGRRVTP
jgi:hypothetical protein